MSHFRACEGTDTEDSLWVYPLPYVDLGPDSVICLDDAALVLSNHHPHQTGDQYLWRVLAPLAKLKIVHHGDYNLQVTNKEGLQCNGNGPCTQRLLYRYSQRFHPPNDDGINDHFFQTIIVQKRHYLPGAGFINRWGQVVLRAGAEMVMDGMESSMGKNNRKVYIST